WKGLSHASVEYQSRHGSINARQGRVWRESPPAALRSSLVDQCAVTDAAAASIEGFKAGYVTIAGLPTWHEVGGEGPAVVLLHGGFSGAVAWAAQAPALVSAGVFGARLL